MGSSARPLHDAGNDRTLERRSHRQVARRSRLTIRPNSPEPTSNPALLHHQQGHDLAFRRLETIWGMGHPRKLTGVPLRPFRRHNFQTRDIEGLDLLAFRAPSGSRRTSSSLRSAKPKICRSPILYAARLGNFSKVAPWAQLPTSRRHTANAPMSMDRRYQRLPYASKPLSPPASARTIEIGS